MMTLTPITRCIKGGSVFVIAGFLSLGLAAQTMAAGPSIASFTLINADTDKPISGYDPMVEGVTLDFAKLGTKNLNIRANADSTADSVRFGYDSNADYRMENGAPFALAGNKRGNYFAWTPTTGAHTVTAIGYTSSNGRGTAGAKATIHFSVGDTTAPSIPTGLTVSSVTTTSFKASWTASTDNIGVSGYDVSINGGTPLSVTGTSYTASGLTAGTAYSVKVRAHDAAGNLSAYSSNVSTTTPLVNNVAPTISISSSGSSFTAPANITFTANATDSDGTISQVEYFKGSTSIGKSTVSPYSVTWSSVAAGTYSITGKATDNSGSTTTSAAISITVAAAPTPTNVLPTVSMTSPASGSSFTAGANITLSANAADSDGTIAHVDFYNGTTLLNSDTTSPYSYTWNAVPAGSYSLKAVAYDNAGGKTDSAIITIKVTSTTTTGTTTPLVGYFVSSSTGSDSYTATQAKNPSTPWKTLAKVNSISFVAGDKIYFKRGDIFTGSLIPKTSGTSTAPITFDAYGTGENPIISNLVDPRKLDTNTTNHDWKPYTGTGVIPGVYYVELASMPTYGPSVLTFNPVGGPRFLTPKGRYPKLDYRTYNLGTPITTTSSTGSTTTSYKNIIDAETTKLPASPAWVGAVLQVRGSGQDSQRSRISAYSATSGSMSLVSGISGFMANGKGYLLYDHVNLFNTAFATGSNAPEVGDWAWVPSTNVTSGTTSGKLYVYFGTGTPSAYEVMIGKPSVTETLYLNGRSYVNVNNITFEGSGGNGIKFQTTTSCSVKNCEVRFAQVGIGYSGTPVNCTVQNNYVHDMTGNGMRLYGTNWKILDNTVTDIGLSINTGDNIGNTQGTGLVIGANGEGYRINSNKISNCALHGMWLGVVNDIQVYYNRIENWGDGKDDCGAIYAWDGSTRVTDTTHHDRYIRNNVILNGNAKGEHKGDVSGAGHGIYLDISNKWVVEDNYVENLKGSGYVSLLGDDLQVRRNIFKNCSTVGNQGGFFFGEGSVLLKNEIFENNVVLSGNKSPVGGNRNNATPGYDHFGLFRNNYYRTTLAAGNACVLDFSGRTWNTWLTQPIESGHVALDLGSTMALENNVAGAVVTYYNNTNASTTITLPTSNQYKNLITGAIVSGSIVLQPYQSAALLKM